MPHKKKAPNTFFLIQFFCSSKLNQSSRFTNLLLFAEQFKALRTFCPRTKDKCNFLDFTVRFNNNSTNSKNKLHNQERVLCRPKAVRCQLASIFKFRLKATADLLSDLAASFVDLSSFYSLLQSFFFFCSVNFFYRKSK